MRKRMGGFMANRSVARMRAPLLLWRDVLGAVHGCERTDLRQAFYVFSTLCGRNVPPNARWPQDLRPAMTCPECVKIAAETARSVQAFVPRVPADDAAFERNRGKIRA